jgi:hypothetical protein
LALVATLGTGFGNIIMVMVIANWARYARLVRSEVLSVKQRDFVTLARIAGVRPLVIMLRHVLPNVLNSVVVLAILDVGRAIILESSLSFLGVGIQPPDVSWGPHAGGWAHADGLCVVAHDTSGPLDRVRGVELQLARALAARGLRSAQPALGCSKSATLP